MRKHFGSGALHRTQKVRSISCCGRRRRGGRNMGVQTSLTNGGSGGGRPGPYGNGNNSGGGVGTPRVSARMLSILVILMASTSITASLLMRHLNPRRFRIHPLPYVSDAGLADPERIVLSFGLSIAALLFAPLALALRARQQLRLSRVARMGAERGGKLASLVGMWSGCGVSLSLIAFVAVPGWYIAHHVLAALFAVTAAIWSLCTSRASTALTMRGEGRRRGPGGMLVMGVLQSVIIGAFAVVWSSVIAGFPWKMVPNKDVRFIVLALLEYVGVAAFLVVVALVGNQLRGVDIVLSIAASSEGRLPVRNSGVRGKLGAGEIMVGAL